MASPREASGGFVTNAVTAFAAALAYLKARLQLAGIEFKEAGVHYVTVLALVVAALVVVVLGYLFLCLAIVFLFAWALGDGHSWIWVTLGMGALHFIAAATFLYMAKARLSQPVFATTLNEFKKDQEWLTTKTQRSR